MKAYLSYSSRGYLNKPTDSTINLHKLCFFNLKKHFDDVHFITDSYSKHFFEDIPWTSISIGLDAVPKDYDNVWSLSKLYAYKEIAKKGDPFIHIDNDVILWKALEQKFLNSEVFVQCPEIIKNHEYETEKFLTNCPYKSIFNCFRQTKRSYNMGIFGGKNLDFIQKYAEQAIEFVLNKENEYFWKNYNGYKTSWGRAVLAEQHFLYVFGIINKQKIKCLFSRWPDENIAQKTGYSHLMLAKHFPDIQFKIDYMVKNINLNKI
jgi:hypothetical protein